MRPFRSDAVLTTCATWSDWETSQRINLASPPALRNSAAAPSPASTFIEHMNTTAPSAANSSAIARPMPCPAPVTIAILSLSLIVLVSQRLAFPTHLGAGDGSACQVGNVKLVEILPAKGHVGRAAEQNRPSVPGEQRFLAGGADPPNLIRRIAADVEISRCIKTEPVREAAAVRGIDFGRPNGLSLSSFGGEGRGEEASFS